MSPCLRALLSAGCLLSWGCFVDAAGGRGGVGGAGGAESIAISTAPSSSGAGDGSTTGGEPSSATTGVGGSGGEGGAPPSCPTGWTPGDLGDCYVIVPPDDPAGAFREDAVVLCANVGNSIGKVARLATPNVTPDIGTLEFLGGGTFDLWIGAVFDEGANNQFVFEGSGEPFPFVGQQDPWASEQPDGMPGESCVMIDGGKLHTYECDDDEFSQPFAAACELVR